MLQTIPGGSAGALDVVPAFFTDLVPADQSRVESYLDLLPGELDRAWPKYPLRYRSVLLDFVSDKSIGELRRIGYEVRTLEGSDGARPDLFHRWTLDELLAQPDHFSWLVKALLADPTYGQIAGEQKTLKSYIATSMAVGVASGTPILGHFHVPARRPVVLYVGEGGRIPWARRLRRICEAMEVDPTVLDLHPRFDVAPLNHKRFQDTLLADLTELRPALVLIDPLYAFHGSDTDARNLHEEGALLSQVSGLCTNLDASLMIVNHMNQTGTGFGLKRITMAGSGEWVDSWMLLGHRDKPNVDAGEFRLTLEVGSRQWGGATYDVDLNIGRFDPDLCMHDGSITWDVRQAEFGRGSAGDADKLLNVKLDILGVVADHTWELTQSEIKVRVGGSRERFGAAFDDLASEDKIKHNMRGRIESGTTKRRRLWGPGRNWPYGGPPESEPDSP